ncbi:MAG: threonine synthase, partial [Clostridia bacterium]|nr:threonine synthase [Clostridia bacterium]
VIVFYPENGVSAVQKAQMVTQTGDNVLACAVRGNFDDAQTGVKRIFAGGMPGLSSANSINIGRLAPQVVYYFSAYQAMAAGGKINLGDTIDFVVPTGNFGDILAGFIARQLGLPIGKLVCASNANDVLTEFLRTGHYDRRRPFHQTLSPSMDILVSSNLERLLFLLSGDEALVASLMRQLADEGHYRAPDALLAQLKALFWAGCCDDEATCRTIGEVWHRHGYLIDTHTAVAWNVAQQYKAAAPEHRPLAVLSTASPYKFPQAVLRGLGLDVPEDGFEAIRALEAATAIPVPEGLRGLDTRPVLHKDVIDVDEMPDYVQRKSQEAVWTR